MATADRETLYVTLDRCDRISGRFTATDRDDREWAKQLVTMGLFEPFQIAGKRGTLWRLTDKGRDLYNHRREMRLEAFNAIRAKIAADDR